MDHILGCHEIIKTDFVRGQNCYLYDAGGRKYIDFEAGIWCTALGHNHRRVNQAMHRQIERIIHLGTRYPSFIAEAAAVEVLDIVAIPGGKCVFLSSGSEAVEFGAQIARRITGRPLLLTFSDSYLAAYGSAGRKSPEEWHLLDWSACAACPHADECDPECSRWRAIPFERIGGFVFEPGSASGLVKFPPTQLVQALASRVKQRDGLIVVNEITTGMGRTGAWFGFQHYALQPDIVALGKGLGNGYPVSAVAMTRDVAGKLEKGAFRYAQSHQNDPLGCAIAREVITILTEDGLIARGSEVGTRFQAGLRRLGERCEAIKEVRGRGLMIAMELSSKPERCPAASVYRELLERGFLVGCYPAANVLRFDPALTIGEEDLAQLLENLGHVLAGAESLHGC